MVLVNSTPYPVAVADIQAAAGLGELPLIVQPVSVVVPLAHVQTAAAESRSCWRWSVVISVALSSPLYMAPPPSNVVRNVVSPMVSRPSVIVPICSWSIPAPRTGGVAAAGVSVRVTRADRLDAAAATTQPCCP